MNKGLILILYLSFISSAVKKIAEFPQIYLYTDEVYVGMISDYFAGTDIVIQANDSDETSGVQFDCSYEFGINRTDFVDFPSDSLDSQYKLLATENTYCYNILASNNDTVILLSLSKIDLSHNVTFNQTVKDNYSGASVKGAVLAQSSLIVLIESWETVQGKKFRRNDILYAGYGDSTLKVSSGFWDLRYRKDILISTTDSDYVACAVPDDGNEKAGIYVFLFNEPEIPILVQVIDRIKYVPNYVSSDSFPTIIDLIIENNFLTILTLDNLMIVFEYSDKFFNEQTFSNFSEFGQAKHLGHTINSLNFLPVTISDYATVYNLYALSKIYYAQSRLNNAEVVYAQDFINYVFFSSTTNSMDAYIEIVYFNYNSMQNITLVNMSQFTNNPNPSGSWLVLSTVFSDVLIWQDFDRIHFFNLSLPSYKFKVSSSKSVNLTIVASDSEGSAESTLSITIYSDLGKIYNKSQYIDSDIFTLTYPVYFVNFTQTQRFGIYEMFSGWNLTYNFINVSNHYFNYTVKDLDSFYHWSKLELKTSYIDAGFYNKVLFLIDSEGYVYKNQTKLHLGVSGAQAIQPISSSDPDVAILYKDLVICYYDDKFLNFSTIRKSFDCSIFITLEDTIVCASNNSVNILSCSTNSIIASIEFLDDFIKDVAICENYIFGNTYIYVLLSNNVYTYQLVGREIVFINYKDLSADRIFCNFNIVVTIQDLHIKVYSEKLEYILRAFELYSGYQNIIMAEYTLLLQNNEEVYYYNIDSSVLNSLLNVYNIGPCTIKSLDSGFLLTNCTSYLDFYISPCPPDCSKISELEFKMINIANTTKGLYEFSLPLNITNSIESLEYYVTFHLNTYDSVIFFDDSYVQYSYSYAYNGNSTYSLQNYLNGYSLDTTLVMNSTGKDSNEIGYQAVGLTDRSYLSYNFTFQTTIADYASVPNLDVLVFITENKVNIFYNGSYRREILSTNSTWNYSCFTVNFISRDENSAVFVCDCEKISNLSGNYYDGKLYPVLQAQPFLMFLTLNLSSLQFYVSSSYFINFTPRLIKIVNSTPNQFLIVCVSAKLEEYQEYFNNEIFVFYGIWNGDRSVSVTYEYFINFFTLGIESFSVMHIDGVFNYSGKKDKKIHASLYVAENFYGILVIRLDDKHARVVQGIPLLGNPPVSLVVCGYNLFVVTLKSSLIVYHIKDDLSLSFYVNYPSSSVDIYYGINSIASCSNYYNPTYISFYLQDFKDQNEFVLRVISLTADFNSSVHKDFKILVPNKAKFSLKSTFKSPNLISFINNNLYTYVEYELNDVSLVFKSMTYNEYKQLIKYNPQGQVNFSIQVNNTSSGFNLTSKSFTLTRTGFSSSHVSDDEVNYVVIVLACASVVLIVLVFISYCVYKRILSKKKVRPEVLQGRFRLQILSMRYTRSTLSWSDINHK